MGCLLGCLALAFPRLALGLVWLLGGNYIRSAYDDQLVWPILGFLFLPLTTLVFAYSSHSHAASGHLTPLGRLLVAVAALFDLGFLGGGSKAARKRRRKDRDDD